MDDKKHLTLEEDIDDKANMLIDRINEETEYMRNKLLKKFLAKLEQETETYRDSELEELKSETSSLLLVSRHSYKKELFGIRESYVNEVFSEIDKKLADFVRSDKYRDFIEACIDKYDVNYNDGYFIIKEDDQILFKNILEKKKINCEIKTEYIKFGGFRFISKKDSILIDETIDNRLETQKIWFQQNSGFII